ncbi:MAG: glycosyltransferase family 2 protein [Bacteroidota bacterium]|nr:glycosyltransferase family 2 protein [Bacteroidota bacterium]
MQHLISRRILVVLPAFNEEENIGDLLNQIKFALEEDSKTSYKVYVVNDGSRDKTEEIVRSMSAEMPIELIVHEVNQGLGATIRDGLYKAVNDSNQNDIIITMDADATHNPGLILRLMRMIIEGHDVVIASRFQPGARVIGLAWYRKLLSIAASIIFRITYPIKGVKDYTCGYRAIRADVLKSAMAEYGDRFFDQDGFQALVDILLKLRRRKLLFGETPLILRYDQKGGMSKMNVGRTIKKTLILIVKRFFVK